GPAPDSEEATIVGSWQVTGNSMELPEGLTAGQTYYWQVTGSSYASPIWAFTMDRRLTIAVENGWNLISLPFTITDASAEALSSFQLMKLNKRRIPVKNTAFTAGTYWLYNDGNPARLLFFPAAEQVPEGGVALEAGWNAPAVPEGGAQLKNSETQVFEYRGGLFRKSAADDSGTFTLDAGRGYFIHSFK
ncbi:MAG: hypothetical protein J6S21_02275, partial [Victivallales bacterium]|nr:hypothetical protein [Victivallales bacterium]